MYCIHESFILVLLWKCTCVVEVLVTLSLSMSQNGTGLHGPIMKFRRGQSSRYKDKVLIV